MVVTNATMPLNERLADADDDEAALYGILVALMLLLPDAVRDTNPQTCCEIMDTVIRLPYTRSD